MGHLYYGNVSEPIEIPDRLLAHLRVVVTTKLRRSESFTLSWRHSEEAPTGLSTIWMQPAIPLRFVFDVEVDTLDAEMLHQFATAAGSSKGLVVDLGMMDENIASLRAVDAA